MRGVMHIVWQHMFFFEYLGQLLIMFLPHQGKENPNKNKTGNEIKLRMSSSYYTNERDMIGMLPLK
jgi:hypothetical protein